MNIANQEVHVWRDHDYEWIPLRQYIEETGLENLHPWRVHAGMTEARMFCAPGVVACDPGGIEDGRPHEVDSRGYLIRTVREFQYSRWKKGRCAYIYYAGPHDGMYLMLPTPLKVSVEVKVML